MKRAIWLIVTLAGIPTFASGATVETVVFETTSAYHHLRVVDVNRTRTLYFDSAPQSRMSLDDPLKGHFEYVEYLHLPWLWNEDIRSVLVIGLGGGSVQRTYRARHPGVDIETVELDPAVIVAARDWFRLEQSPHMKVTAVDGRQFLRRTANRYDLIVLDAYTANRYGSGIPYSLVTREFFQLVREHLTDRGVFACNIIGSIGRVETGRNLVLASVYRTLQTSFPLISLFVAEGSGNVVAIAPLSGEVVSSTEMLNRADRIARAGGGRMAEYEAMIGKLTATPPAGAAEALVLMDDFAPVDGLLKIQPGGSTLSGQEIEALRKAITEPAGVRP
jgi:spermidine synthase